MLNPTSSSESSTRKPPPPVFEVKSQAEDSANADLPVAGNPDDEGDVFVYAES